MATVFRWFGAALFLIPLSIVLLAQTPALDIRMGLWEMTMTADIGGEMPGMDTSKMTPAEKAQMEAAMKGMMGTHTNVTKSCLKKEDVDLSKMMMDGDSDRKCRQTVTTNTRATLEANIACTGEQATTGQMRVDALSPTSMKATMKSTSTGRGGAMTVNMTMTGKWLGADCKGVD